MSCDLYTDILNCGLSSVLLPLICMTFQIEFIKLEASLNLASLDLDFNDLASKRSLNLVISSIVVINVSHITSYLQQLFCDCIPPVRSPFSNGAASVLGPFRNPRCCRLRGPRRASLERRLSVASRKTSPRGSG